MLKPHTGRRKRSISAAEVESFVKRRNGTQAERDRVMRLYQPVRWKCECCSIDFEQPMGERFIPRICVSCRRARRSGP